MKKGRLFNTSLLGFNKNDVINYLNCICDKYAYELHQKTERISRLEDELFIMQKANKALTAPEIIEAAQNASLLIIENAEMKSRSMICDAEKTILSEQEKLDSIEKHINSIKAEACEKLNYILNL